MQRGVVPVAATPVEPDTCEQLMAQPGVAGLK